MTNKKKVTRRDFLKLGGLAAVSLPTINQVGRIENDDLLESEEAYGGFLVRRLVDDDPPFIIDEANYQRFDSTNVIFSRNMWDQEYIQKVSAVEKAYALGDPGYEQFDVALNDAAMFCAAYNGTVSAAPMTGRHDGLLALDPGVPPSPVGVKYEGRWDHSTKTPEEVAQIVKKAALFLGASLVGVAPFNEKWIYSDYFDMDTLGAVPIEITEVEEVVLPEGQVSRAEAGEMIQTKLKSMEGSEIKELMIDVTQSEESPPPGAPPIAIIKAMPASQFKDMVSMFITLPTNTLRIMIEKLGMEIEIADVDPGESAVPRYLEDGTLAIPETMQNVIVLAFEMDFDSIETSPAAQSESATLQGYSKMAITAGSLAKFIKGLGYNAIPCGNNTGISVPQAIEAGLGESARNGIMITPKYGPRVRLAKVITDLPMATDKPIKFGVEEFCNVCMKCAELCPTQAISYGDKTMEGSTISNNPGVLKWSVNPEECYYSWAANSSGCGVCIRVCPFNKPEGWLHDATRILIGAKSGSLDNLMVKLDDASGYGKPEPNFNFWESDNFIHIKE